MEATHAGEPVAHYSQRDEAAYNPRRGREHSPDLRVSDIPADAMAIIADCQVPLVLVGVTWPYELAKSPLLYANAAMLDLIGRNAESDLPAGLQLASCSGSVFRSRAARLRSSCFPPCRLRLRRAESRWPERSWSFRSRTGSAGRPSGSRRSWLESRHRRNAVSSSPC